MAAEKKANSIAFRLPEPLFTLLEERAQGEGISFHQCARRLVADGLTDTRTLELERRFDELRGELEDQRRMLVRLGALMLKNFEEGLSTEEALARAEQNISP